MNDIRYYRVLWEIADEINTMNINEVNGAIIILQKLFGELYSQYFEKGEVINVGALVKTLEELTEIVRERRLHLENYGLIDS